MYTKHTNMHAVCEEFIELKTDKPLWMQIIHGDNLNNILQGRKPVPISEFF